VIYMVVIFNVRLLVIIKTVYFRFLLIFHGLVVLLCFDTGQF